MNRTIPFPLVTPRLELTPYKPEFAEDLFELKSLRETHRYNYSAPLSRENARNFAEKMSARDYTAPGERLELAVIFQGQYIGFAGLKGGDLQKNGTGEIFYTLHRDFFRRGLGFEKTGDWEDGYGYAFVREEGEGLSGTP